MNAKFIRAFVAVTALAGACAATGCVSDRPSRNGVFNENQYVKKSFLVRPGDGTKPDPGWFMKSTIVATSTPNPLSGMNLFQGAESSSYNIGGAYVRFDITQDKLRLVNLREISNDPNITAQGTRVGEVVNAWPVTNVDLKYRINLDGEKTNFYEENQELDWQVRQWVKINFAKNDLADLAPYGSYVNMLLAKCTETIDVSATLVPNSLIVDEENEYMQWEISVTLPLTYASQAGGNALANSMAEATQPPTDAETCIAAMGQAGITANLMGRDNVTLQVMYSMVRPDKVTDGAYAPLQVDEKDPIRKKYGAFEITPIARDVNSGLLEAQQLVIRHDPNKDLTYYLAQGMPDVYQKFFTAQGGVQDQTAAIFAKAGAKAKVKILNYNDKDTYGDGLGPVRRYGDVRYNFINYHSDIDGQDQFGGIAQFFADPRTGEAISTSVNVSEGPIKDTVLARLDFYLQTIGAEYLTPTGDFDDQGFPPPANCKDGDTIPLVPATVANAHNGNSTVYQKMQQYLQKPVATFGKLGPRDFVVPQDSDFYNAFFALVPYHIYKDPNTNYFVTPEGGTGVYGAASQWAALQKVVQFNKLAGLINRGTAPFDVDVEHGGFQNMLQFTKTYRGLSQSVLDYNYIKQYNHGSAQFDDIAMISYLDVFGKNARHCVNGAWESRADYTKNLITSLYENVLLHEFGHTLGLRHNFMGSVDQRNFPHYKDGAGRDHIGLYSSSIMEYGVTASDVFFRGANGTGPGWGPDDIASIGWIYGNTKKNGDSGPGLSGQTSPTAPWNDPYGFDANGKEITYLFCTDEHLLYTPMCRQNDLGATPSEIVANALDNYEWQYHWTNFRLYRKFFSEANYAQFVANFFTDQLRWFSQWRYDWSGGEIADTLRRIGVNPPMGAPAATYYQQLTAKFNNDISMASQLVATFHEAIIQQTSGQRPYRTIYDNYFGDVTQQGIIVDKLQSLVNWTSLYETTNFDPTQAQGFYLTAFGGVFGDSAYQTVAEGAAESMVGGSYDIFPFYRPTAVAQFAASTHDINYAGRIELRDWIGGKVFYRERDFLDFLHAIAVKYPLTPGYGACQSLDTCAWDPRTPRILASDLTHSDNLNTFQGPDGRTYIWAYIADRNQWVLVDRDRNTAAYVIMVNWTNAVINGEADGSGANGFDPYGLLLPMKYFLDSFNQYN
jgi:hypothetical protein